MVRFNEIQTTRSHVQGVGRARAQRARVYYFENCPRVECERAEARCEGVWRCGQVMRAVAKQAQGPKAKEVPRWLKRSGVHPFPVPGSGVEVNIRRRGVAFAFGLEERGEDLVGIPESSGRRNEM